MTGEIHPMKLLVEADVRIAELKKENARLREALTEILEFEGPPKMSETIATAFVRIRDITQIARDALACYGGLSKAQEVLADGK